MAQHCEGKEREYRESIHAGTWYPGRPKELKEMINAFLKNARARVHGEIYGLIAPHAGYIYSGPVAAFAYKAVEGLGVKNGLHGLFFIDVDNKFTDGIKQINKPIRT